MIEDIVWLEDMPPGLEYVHQVLVDAHSRQILQEREGTVDKKLQLPDSVLALQVAL